MDETASRIGWLVAAFVGVAVALVLYPMAVFDVTNVDWLMYSGDTAQHFLGWQFFRNEEWQIPPGRLVGFGLEMGSSIVYTDSIPLLALLLKPVSSVLPDSFQYTGLWIASCHALASAMAWRCGWLATGRMDAAAACAALALLSPVVALRFGHFALMAHWLIWWALGDCLAQRPGARSSRLACVCVAALVHAYLMAIVLAIVAADIVRRVVVLREWRLREGATLVVGTGLLLIGTLWLSGYFVLGSLGGGGAYYGKYAAHLGTFWNPIGPSPFLDGYTLASERALEGSSYLGFGAICLVLAGGTLFVTHRAARKLAWSHWPLMLAGTVLSLIALSHQVRYGDRVLIEFPLPDAVLPALETFRASGRLLWLAYYASIAGAVLLIATTLPKRAAACMLGVAVAFQVADLAAFHVTTSQGRGSLLEASIVSLPRLKDPFWHEAASRYKRVLVAPMEHGGPHWATLARYASENGMAINVGQFARASWPRFEAAHGRVLNDLATGQLQDDALYVVTRPDEVRIAPLEPRHGTVDVDGLMVVAPGWSTGTGIGSGFKRPCRSLSKPCPPQLAAARERID